MSDRSKALFFVSFQLLILLLAAAPVVHSGGPLFNALGLDKAAPPHPFEVGPSQDEQYRFAGKAKLFDVDAIVESGKGDIIYPPTLVKELKPEQKSLLTRLGDSVKQSLAPTKAYGSIVNRYQRWLRHYRALQKQHPEIIRGPIEVLKEEYTIVDQQMAKVDCKNQAAGKSDTDGASDFVFEALSRVIDRLELRLDNLRKQKDVDESSLDESADAEAAEPEADVDPELVKDTMDKVRRSVISNAKKLLVGEAGIFARTAALGLASTFVLSRAEIVGDPLGQLAPLVTLLGYANTSLLTLYLKNVEFRVGLAVLHNLNPFRDRSCKLNKDD